MKTSTATYIASGFALAAFSVGGAFGATGVLMNAEADESAVEVTNKNDKPVNENAAQGQERAEQARQAAAERKAQKDAEREVRKAAKNDDGQAPLETSTGDESSPEIPEQDSGDEEAGDTQKSNNGAKGQPSAQAGDKPNENAFTHPQGKSKPAGPKVKDEPRDLSQSNPGAPGKPEGGRGPSPKAGDKPNEKATEKSNNGKDKGKNA